MEIKYISGHGICTCYFNPVLNLAGTCQGTGNFFIVRCKDKTTCVTECTEAGGVHFSWENDPCLPCGTK